MGSCVPSSSLMDSKLFPLWGNETSTFCQSIPAKTFRRRGPNSDGCLTPSRKNTEAQLREIEMYFFCCIFQTSH